jgi:hypothetical protein
MGKVKVGSIDYPFTFYLTLPRPSCLSHVLVHSNPIYTRALNLWAWVCFMELMMFRWHLEGFCVKWITLLSRALVLKSTMSHDISPDVQGSIEKERKRGLLCSSTLQYIWEHIVQTQNTLIFWMSCLHHKACAISLEYNCLIKKSDYIRPTHLNAYAWCPCHVLCV